jgi:hypothetical protein
MTAVIERPIMSSFTDTYEQRPYAPPPLASYDYAAQLLEKNLGTQLYEPRRTGADYLAERGTGDFPVD